MQVLHKLPQLAFYEPIYVRPVLLN